MSFLKGIFPLKASMRKFVPGQISFERECEEAVRKKNSCGLAKDEITLDLAFEAEKERKDASSCPLVNISQAFREPMPGSDEYIEGNDGDYINEENDTSETEEDDSWIYQSGDEENWSNWSMENQEQEEDDTDDEEEDDNENEDRDYIGTNNLLHVLRPVQFIVVFTKPREHYYCIICACHLHGDKSVEQHVNGKRHEKCLSRYGNDLMTLAGKRQYYCLCCWCRISGYQNLYSHVVGRMHCTQEIVEADVSA